MPGGSYFFEGGRGCHGQNPLEDESAKMNVSYFSLKAWPQTSPNKKRDEIAPSLSQYLRFGRPRPPIFMGCRAEPPCAM
jgi:hypothetical protein